MKDAFRIDEQKLSFHPGRVSQWLEQKDDWESAKHIYPLYVEVSPTGICQHRCTFCAIAYLGYKSDFIDPVIFHDRAKEMGAAGIKAIMFGGEGEPTVHPKINIMVGSCISSGIDVAFTTNGALLDRLAALPACKWVKVSLNAGTRETYAKVHRTKEKDWDTVWANLRAAVKRKGECTLGVQMVLLPENEHELPLLQKLCDDAGVDYLVAKSYSQHKFSSSHEYENFVPALPEEAPNVVVRKNAILTHEIPYQKCNATPFFWAYLMSNGDLYSCSAYLSDSRFNLGNINTQTFKEIWHGEKRRANWEYVRKHLDIKECRINCRMNQSNVYLNDLVAGVPHQSFI